VSGVRVRAVHMFPAAIAAYLGFCGRMNPAARLAQVVRWLMRHGYLLVTRWTMNIKVKTNISAPINPPMTACTGVMLLASSCHFLFLRIPRKLQNTAAATCTAPALRRGVLATGGFLEESKEALQFSRADRPIGNCGRMVNSTQ